jgi:hypothetical protein
MKKYLLLLTMISLVLFSCKKEGDLILDGTPTLMGAVGNVFSSTHSISGLSDVTAEVTEFEDGVSVITATGTLTNPDLVGLANALAPLFPSNIEINGSDVSVELNVRFTDKGIASVYEDGELILVKYDAQVGDKYTANVGGKTITNEVVARSTDDDYFWDGFLIKVIEIESTGQDAGNLDKVTYYVNHRFGIVGVKALFDNSNVVTASIYSNNEN